MAIHHGTTFAGSVDPLEGGVYSLSEAARYTLAPRERVRDWFTSQDPERPSLLEPDYDSVDSRYAISFYDLIDLYVVVGLRNAGLSLRKIRKNYETLEDKLETKHPFCHRDIFTDGRSVFVGGEGSVSEVMTEQRHFFDVMEPYLARIEYHSRTRLARRWTIFDGVVIDPRYAFGKPVVENTRGSITGLTTYTLAREFFANSQDAGLVADLYDIDTKAVTRAVSFEREFGEIRAA